MEMANQPPPQYQATKFWSTAKRSKMDTFVAERHLYYTEKLERVNYHFLICCTGIKMARGKKGFQPKQKKTAPLLKAVKAIAKSEAMKSQETKLVIVQPFFGPGSPSVTNLISNRFVTRLNIGNLSYLQNAIPTVQPSAGGEQSDNIVGSKINLVSGHTDFLVCYKQGYTASSDMIVKIFCLISKSAKSEKTASNLPSDDLLRKGNAETIDWSPANTPYTPLLEDYPVNTLAWKVSKVFTCRLSKNSGGMNLDSSTPPPAPNLSDTRNYHKFKWHWGKEGPNVLKYEEPLQQVADNYPNNFMPMYGVCAYYPDGTPVGEPGDAQPITLAVSNTMYFKDG